MEDDAVQLRQIVFQPGLEIGLPEEARVGQAGADHLFVACDDRLAAVSRNEVRGQHEAVGKAARCRIAQHEALLVGTDGQADALVRDRQERLVEGARQHHRPFHQSGDFLQQAFVFHQLQPQCHGLIARIMHDHVLAPVGIEDDLLLFQLGHVVVEAADGEGLVAMEAVAARRVASGDAVNVEGDHFRLFRFRAEGGDDGLQRSHPAQGAGAPAHGFGPGEVADDAGHHVRNDFLCRAARLLDDGDVELALLRVALDRGFLDGGEACTAQEAFQRLRRRADARALALFAGGLRGNRQAGDMQGKAAGRGECLRALIGQTGFHQRIGDQRLEVICSTALHAGRDFLAEQFKQEIGHGSEPSIENIGAGRGLALAHCSACAYQARPKMSPPTLQKSPGNGVFSAFCAYVIRPACRIYLQV